MNLLDHTVTEVKSKPYFKHLWCVDVMADSYGIIMPTTIYFKTKEAAEQVKIGYEFKA